MSGYEVPGAVDSRQLLPLMAMVREGEVSAEVRRAFRKHAHAAPKKELVVLKEDLPRLLADLRHLAPTLHTKTRDEALTLNGLQEILWACAMEGADSATSVQDQRPLRDRFTVVTSIGEGATGKVMLAKDRETQLRRAVKMVYKRYEGQSLNPKQLQVQEQSYRRELKALSTMDHPHILRLHQHFEDEEGWYLVLDYCPCGDLVGLMEEYREDGHACPMTGLTAMPLAFALKVVYQVLLALAHMHKRKMMHLDIKGQNIMFQVSYRDTILPEEPAPHPAPTRVMKEPHVVLSDFGTALEKGTVLSSPIGTCAFMAPEVWKCELVPEADVWGLGVVFFQMLGGKMPFNPPNIIDLAQEYWQMEPLPPWHEVPYTAPQCQEVCNAMLSISKRPSAEELLVHPLFAEMRDDEEKPCTLPLRYAERLLAFAECDVLQKCMRMRLARAWSSNQMPSFRRLFVSLADASGRLTAPRLGAALSAALAERCGSAASAQRAAQSAAEALVGEDGLVGFTYFVAALADLANPKYENFLMRAFEQVDHDDDGLVGIEGLAELLTADTQRHAVLLQEYMVALTGHDSAGAKFEASHFLRHLRGEETRSKESGDSPDAPAECGGVDGFFQRFAGTLLDSVEPS